MAGTLIVSNLTTDTDNTFIVRSNTGTTLFSANTSGIDIANSIGATAITSDKILSIANTKISGNIISSQITSVANTQLTGNIASSQITSNPTFYGNVSVTGVIGVGGATPTSNGSGISFPATQSASSDANTLDDYEEGTWTPTVTPSSGSLTAYTSSGVYVKVGKLVTITGDFQLTTVGTASGSVSVGGVPFNGTGPSTAYRIAIGSGSEDALTGVAYQVVLGGGGNNILLRTAAGANITFSNGYGYVFTITYQASA